MLNIPPIALFASAALGAVGLGFAGGWFGAGLLAGPDPASLIAPSEPVFTDMGLFHINFGAGRQIGSMRAGLLVSADAARDLSPAVQHDRLLDLLVAAAEKPAIFMEAKVGPGIVPLDQSRVGPGSVKPDLEALAKLASYMAPDWMLQLKLVSASNPPLLPKVDAPEDVRPLEEPADASK